MSEHLSQLAVRRSGDETVDRAEFGADICSELKVSPVVSRYRRTTAVGSPKRLHRLYVCASGASITKAVFGGFSVGEFIRSVRQACDLLRQISASTTNPELARQAARVAARMDRGVVSDVKV